MTRIKFSDEVKKYLKEYTKLREEIEKHTLKFAGQPKVKVIKIEDVGTSFEPRTEITYEVDNFECKGQYRETLILEKNLENIIATIDGEWINFYKK